MRCKTIPTDVGENGTLLVPSRVATTNEGGSGLSVGINVGINVESGAEGKTSSDSDDSGGGFDGSLNDL